MRSRKKLRNKIYINWACALQLITFCTHKCFKAYRISFVSVFRFCWLPPPSSLLLSSFLSSCLLSSWYPFFLFPFFLVSFFLVSGCLLFFRSSYLFLVFSFLLFSPFFPSDFFQIYSFILFTTTFLPKATVSRGRSCFQSLKNYSVVFVLALIFQKITFYDFHEIFFLILKMLAETPLNPSSLNSQWFQVPLPHWVQCKCLTFTYHTSLLNDFSGGKLPIRISEEGPKNFYFDFAQ